MNASIQPLRLDSNVESGFGAPVPVAQPIGDLVANTRTAQAQVHTEQGVSIGLWECTPGIWRRQLLKKEFSHFIKGRGVFTPDGGQPVSFSAGDALFFPENCAGTWDIQETVLKAYVIIESTA